MRSNRRALDSAWLIAAVSITALSLAACSTSSQEDISIFLVNCPSTLTVGQPVSLTASVGYDSSDAGVDWTCSGGVCGTFDPAHTASGVKTVFTAPATAGTVTITATASADVNAKASATMTVVPAGSNAMLNGPYVFFVQGMDGSGSYCAAGTIVADGNGSITGGEQDYSNASLHAGPDAVTGSYSIGPDKRGSITLEVNDPVLPNNGVETFSIAIVSATHALIIQFDGSAVSSGSLDAQASSAVDPAAISGAFAFTAQGADYVYHVPVSYGGVLAMSASSGTISGGKYFVKDGGAKSSGSFGGTMTGPDLYGRGTMTLTMGQSFSYYAVQGQVLRLVGKTGRYSMTGGGMFGQGEAGAGATFSDASLAGDYVLFESGETVVGTLALAGLFSADGAGNLTTGVADANDAGTATFGSIAGTALYSIDGDGSGTLDLPVSVDALGHVSSLLIFAVDPAINLLDPNGAAGGGGALVMDYDDNAVATGYIVPRSSGAFEGGYALNLQFIASLGECDWVGEAEVAEGTLAGTVDVNESGTASAGLTLSGACAADAVNAGRWTGSLTAGGVARLASYYQVSPALFVIVLTDPAAVGIGLLEME